MGVLKNWIDRGELAAIRVGPRRVRIESTELERFIAESSAARIPDEGAARTRFEEALVAGTTENVELAAALRQLANAATELARSLPRS